MVNGSPVYDVKCLIPQLSTWSLEGGWLNWAWPGFSPRDVHVYEGVGGGAP